MKLKNRTHLVRRNTFGKKKKNKKDLRIEELENAQELGIIKISSAWMLRHITVEGRDQRKIRTGMITPQ